MKKRRMNTCVHQKYTPTRSNNQASSKSCIFSHSCNHGKCKSYGIKKSFFSQKARKRSKYGQILCIHDRQDSMRTHDA